MEKAKFYQRLQTIAEYSIGFVVFSLLIFAVGHKLFRLSIGQSVGVALTLILVIWLYRVMGRFGKN